ncbi:acyltransferase [Chitinophaga sp. Ak27]|uniref:acyltransferase family protein n=1 Tax=Chitinophaga sp. Ak27 TaxID=2726116 RepID=UPI00293B984F|nr:acyltransferase [Chitinophaga sp. Ak27]
MDGLRFIAIFSVFIFHVSEILNVKDKSIYYDAMCANSIWKTYISHGGYGVQLFFAISGFILALPFVQHYLAGAKQPVMKQYFLRRLTRLEPPYILIMILLFVYIVFLQHKYTFNQLLPSLLASLTYSHNFFYGADILPIVNPVAWTLEIEVQFYILAPLLAAFFFKSHNAYARRIKIISAILVFIVIQQLYVFKFRWLYDQMQFFLLGFLLADLYVEPLNLQVSKWSAIISGALSLFGIWLYRPEARDPFLWKVGWGVALPVMIFVLYYLALFTIFWKNIFSKKFLVVIGGMCYTIYLIHGPIISIVANYLLKYQFSKWSPINYLIISVVFSLITLGASCLFFIVVERPCMQKDWYKRLLFLRKNVIVPARLNTNALAEVERAQGI